MKQKMNLSNFLQKSKLNRWLPYLLGVLSLLSSFYLFHYIKWMGFSDGHLTELGRAERVLFKPFIWIFALFAGFFIYLGITHNKEKTYKKLFISVLILLWVISLLIFAHYHLALYLEDGTGI